MTKEEFCEALNEHIDRLSIPLVEVADRYEVAVSTVQRWLKGQSAPLPRFAAEIIRDLASMKALSSAGPKKYLVTFSFDDPMTRDGFLEWFLRVGDQEYWQYFEHRPEEPTAYFKDWPKGLPQHLENIQINAPTSSED